MASSQVFVSSIFTFFFLLPQITSSAVICKASSCDGSENPLVMFPYRLKGTDANESCGYPGFDLSCNNKSQTILTLNYSGDVVVERIDYYEQSIYIDFDDPDHCFARRLLQNFTLSGTPFQFPAFGVYVTFLNCSANVTMIYGQAIDCLSGDGYKIWITPSAYRGFLMTPPPSCQVILMALAPMSQLPPTRLLMQLTWSEPSCGECVAGDGYCARKNATTLDVGCFQALSSPSSNGGLPRSAKYGIIIGVGIPGLLCLIGLSCYLCGRIRVYRRRHNPNTQLTSINISPQRSVLAMGLDGPTIESYPKTLLGESRRLPKPSDNTCPICLSEYQPKEELRTIPECNHYFHVNCIDEWLKLNGTCPLCRNSPDGSALVTPSSLSSSSSTSLSSSL